MAFTAPHSPQQVIRKDHHRQRNHNHHSAMTTSPRTTSRSSVGALPHKLPLATMAGGQPNTKQSARPLSSLVLYVSMFAMLTLLTGLSATISVLDGHVQREQQQLLRDPKTHDDVEQASQQQQQPALSADAPRKKHTVSKRHGRLGRSAPAVVNSGALTLKKHIKTVPPPPGHAFILFRGDGKDAVGQGAGNILQGLLAAHLLGLEFNRTVCVDWSAFGKAFDYANPAHAELCQGAVAADQEWHIDHRLLLWNYVSKRGDECSLQSLLASREGHPVISFGGNTYPGWRSDIPDNLFHQFYRPKPELVQVLPFGLDKPLRRPPKIAVHLRAPDGKDDWDRSVDEASLQHLGNLLRDSGAYLVTNRPDWYQRFHDCCGWSYDTDWIVERPIQHGARGMYFGWTGANGGQTVQMGFTESDQELNEQNLKLWSDWYTLLHAEKVYHSNSDFSRSAVHWNADATGYQLAGVQETHEMVRKNGKTLLKTKKELRLVSAPYDAVKMHIPALVDRLQDPTGKVHEEDSCEFLRFCAAPTTAG